MPIDILWIGTLVIRKLHAFYMRESTVYIFVASDVAKDQGSNTYHAQIVTYLRG